ncbi:uncharacterized protein N7446_003747 [Penicillium canescens]|uniref:gamma-glutamylcyclotransferase n=1 Tax=Penicillium canescens TaxID=5083 RepID=A0AAD6N425_PENCN|nr:uncharacterized protein N7446_003747 [Penicillium canescens]KAJ6027657.1 hypothetical protein N7460_012474 [Penicillium canescens]KAJ6040935.1 hypothetical protein N7444_009840 [Penicillium canescens]KAJ6066710.1 hypothetical protein N7446_003747 [Penicillium canescens]
MIRNQLPPQADEAVRTSRCRFSAIAPLTRLRALLPGAISGPTDPNYKSNTSPIPSIPIERRRASSIAASLDQDEGLAEKITEHGVGVPDTIAKEETVLYLAYGSNLASKTFRGVRGINPLSQMGVFVPELRLTFDLPGVPYAEPCFAGTQYRDPSTPPTHDFDFPLEDDETDVSDSEYLSEKAALMSRTLEVEVHGAGYHKRRWYKPLVGVVYEVTLADYAKIIATEGGGRGYRDGVIDCYPFPEDYDPSDPVPYQPSTTPFKARTLLSPAADDARLKMQSLKSRDSSLLSHGPKLSWWYTVCLHSRPDPDYAQPSARYLGLIKTGAEEHDLPETYREYLAQIRTYRITTTRQKIGKGIFLALWLPWVLLALTLSKIFAGSDGRSPQWLVALSNVLFSGMWKSYDRFFARVFGDGERTLDDIPAW